MMIGGAFIFRNVINLLKGIHITKLVWLPNETDYSYFILQICGTKYSLLCAYVCGGGRGGRGIINHRLVHVHELKCTDVLNFENYWHCYYSIHKTHKHLTLLFHKMSRFILLLYYNHDNFFPCGVHVNRVHVP